MRSRRFQSTSTKCSKEGEWRHSKILKLTVIEATATLLHIYLQIIEDDFKQKFAGMKISSFMSVYVYMCVCHLQRKEVFRYGVTNNLYVCVHCIAIEVFSVQLLGS